MDEVIWDAVQARMDAVGTGKDAPAEDLARGEILLDAIDVIELQFAAIFQRLESAKVPVPRHFENAHLRYVGEQFRRLRGWLRSRGVKLALEEIIDNRGTTQGCTDER